MHHEFAIICAKPEELRQVIAVFDEKKFKRMRGRRLLDQVYEIPSSEGPMSLLVTTCNAMGHMPAAVRTAQVITVNQPSVIIFLGTAASLRPEKIQIGDVVIPRKAVSRVYEKVSEKGQDDYERRVAMNGFRETFFDENALISDISTEDCTVEALTAMAGVEISRIKLEAGSNAQVTIGEQQYSLRKPTVFDDVDIFSCGMIVDSVSYRTFLTRLADESMRKVGIIDMESHGFFSAIRALKNSPAGAVADGIMIRGISDYAGRKQQTEALPNDWKVKSLRNAALVAQRVVERIAG